MYQVKLFLEVKKCPTEMYDEMCYKISILQEITFKYTDDKREIFRLLEGSRGVLLQHDILNEGYGIHDYVISNTPDSPFFTTHARLNLLIYLLYSGRLLNWGINGR